MIDIDAQMVRIVQTTDVALRLISARLLTLLCLVMTGGIFGWALAAQTTLGCIIATIWGLTIFNPVLWIGRKGMDHHVRDEAGPALAEPDHAVQVQHGPGPDR